MLDYNHTRSFADMLNEIVDAALMDENAAHPRREYLGGSRVGHACERALQFEFAGAPKDEGADFPGRTLRIFAIGHVLEDLAIKWLRAAGIDLYTRKGNDPDGQQFGFSVAGGRIRGHVDGIIAGGPMRAVFEVMGITDIVAKSHGSSNPYNMVRATLDALTQCTTAYEIASKRGKSVEDIFA
jgi:hypothetical protein